MFCRAVLAFVGFSRAWSSFVTAPCINFEASLGVITLTLFMVAWILGVSSKSDFFRELTKSLKSWASVDVDSMGSTWDFHSGFGGRAERLGFLACLGCCWAGNLGLRWRGEGCARLGVEEVHGHLPRSSPQIIAPRGPSWRLSASPRWFGHLANGSHKNHSWYARLCCPSCTKDKTTALLAPSRLWCDEEIQGLLSDDVGAHDAPTEVGYEATPPLRYGAGIPGSASDRSMATQPSSQSGCSRAETGGSPPKSKENDHAKPECPHKNKNVHGEVKAKQGWRYRCATPAERCNRRHQSESVKCQTKEQRQMQMAARGRPNPL